MRKGIVCQEKRDHRVLPIQIVHVSIKCWVMLYRKKGWQIGTRDYMS